MTGSFQQANFDSDANHFIYCPEGDTVQIDVLAKFLDGTDCDDECSHGPRSYTWTVTGATNYTIDSQTDGPHKSFITVTLGEAGDSISIQCAVSATSEGFCDEDRFGNPGEHGGDHGEATAACTIKLWRIDMELLGHSPTPPSQHIYNIEFAKSVTAEGTLVGASPAAAQGSIHPWEWESWIDNQLHSTMNDSSSWTGEMVAETQLKLKATVVNGCDPFTTASAPSSIEVIPDIRRTSWKMTNVPASIGTDPDWWKNVEHAFPGLTSPTPMGLNTNDTQKYRDLPTEVVTPIYVDLSITNPVKYDPDDWPSGVPNDYGDFSGRVTEIASGPNEGLYYNSSTSLFEVDRIALLNFWTTPQGTWPPTMVPNPGSYTNWLDMYTSAQQSCGCSSPGSHGASGVSNIRHQANIWHESSGCPGSDNQEKPGHQIRIKDAVEGPEPHKFDALWQADLVYATSELALRVADEAIRNSTSILLTTEAGKVHTYVAAGPQQHNFTGFF